MTADAAWRVVESHKHLLHARLDELAQLDGLGGSIRAHRVEFGWTHSELAERSGVP